MRVSSSQVFLQSLASMQRHQVDIAKLQNQITSGKQHLRPSDAPATMGRTLNLEQTSRQTQQFQENITVAENRLALEETVLNDATLILQRTRELAIQGNNTALGDDARRAIASEIRERIGELISLGNTVDANGDYLFSGYQGQQKPLITEKFGNKEYVRFAGDQGVRFIQVSESKQIKTGDSGFDIFFNVPSNYAFVTEAVISNTGNGVISPAYPANPDAITGDRYRIEFTGPSNYDVINESTGNTVHSDSYVSGNTLEFEGIETIIKGTPVAGDQFFVQPGKSQSIFFTLEKLASTLEAPTPTAADDTRVSAVMGTAIDDLGKALDNVTEFRTQTGARLNSLDSQHDQNEAYELQIQSTLSQLRDLDYVEAIGQLQFQMFALEAAQASFARIEGNSLFNYLR